MALALLDRPDGRAALPAFTGLDTLASWSAQARPVPRPGPRGHRVRTRAGARCRGDRSRRPARLDLAGRRAGPTLAAGLRPAPEAQSQARRGAAPTRSMPSQPWRGGSRAAHRRHLPGRHARRRLGPAAARALSGGHRGAGTSAVRAWRQRGTSEYGSPDLSRRSTHVRGALVKTTCVSACRRWGQAEVRLPPDSLRSSPVLTDVAGFGSAVRVFTRPGSAATAGAGDFSRSGCRSAVARPEGVPISVEPRINDRIRVPEVRLLGRRRRAGRHRCHQRCAAASGGGRSRPRRDRPQPAAAGMQAHGLRQVQIRDRPEASRGAA